MGERGVHLLCWNNPLRATFDSDPIFVRPGELRAAEWSEFDLANAEWRIPGARMKMGEPHIVPLARQAVALLRELQPFAKGRALSFSVPSYARPPDVE